MQIASFIARRMLRSDDRERISRPIVRIAATGIAVGMALMIVSMAVVRGFQEEVRNKVIGFGAHVQVMSNDDNRSRESLRIDYDPAVYRAIRETPGVRHVQVFATKPGIIETKEALQGIVIKGVGRDFDWSFLRSVLTEGAVPDSASPARSILLSSWLAARLKLKVGDKASIYFVNDEDDARQQNFTVSGIYETGLEDFDRQYVFMDIAWVQKYSGWGLQAQILVDTACVAGSIAVGGLSFGGGDEHTLEWKDSDWNGEGPFFIQPVRDTTLTLVVSDNLGTAPDTASVRIDFLDDTATDPCRPYRVVADSSAGSEQRYIGGYEVLISDYNDLFDAGRRIEMRIPFYLRASGITERSPEIFAWLGMLDINVVIIIVLMVAISIINMTSALLILILERQQMIGTLKAFGILDRQVLRIFLVNAAAIIGRGLLWGNVIGIGLCLVQHYTGVLALDPVNYYVDQVPIRIDAVSVLLMNAGTLGVCVLFMVLPALYVTTITPIRAIRFD